MHKGLWDNFISKAKNATFLFHRDFMEYHKDRFDDASVLIKHKDELKAVFPANISSGIVHSHQGLTYGGLVLDSSIKLPEVIACFQALMQHYENKGIKTIWIKSLPKIYHLGPSDELDYVFFKIEAQLFRCDLLSVVHPPDINYSKSRREGFRRAIKSELSVEETDDLQPFWNEVLIPNLKSKFEVEPLHTLEEIKKLRAYFPENIRQFNVYDNSGKLIAGCTIFESERVAHAQYIAANGSKNELGSLDFLHDHLLRNVFKDKEFFDFGKSNEDEGQRINEGLLFWKEGFGARSISHNFYSIQTSKHNSLNTIFK